MFKRLKKFSLTIFSLLIVMMLTSISLFAARDLNSAAGAAVSQVKIVAGTLSGLGILVGAILYNIPGAIQWGQRAFVGGLIGAVATYGGQSLVEGLRRVFGG